ncbi:hypothetical protein RHSIM_Rhsim09G0203300 [Rhododendron simsii]|uniref:UBA domain-containing protein n=1 Tax=Rhododendron simsii TaxID=118357 RepID=A0A834GI88_RHOSS|nr:hypothetical protein RHSIM_Rhsim09G0203300 [Rhododendron simsii]
MDYDFRNRANPPYDSQAPVYRPTTTSSSSTTHTMYAPSSLYPRVGQSGHSLNSAAVRASNFHHPSPSSSSCKHLYPFFAGLGIRVAIKPEYRITPPPQLSPQVGDIPRSTFQFDFELERKILAEAERDSLNWTRLGLENLPSKTAGSTSSSVCAYTFPGRWKVGSAIDPVVSKYIASGLSREAVPLAVANYGDNPTKVREFVNGYTLLREMGFSSTNVSEALLMYDNDTDKALAHFLNSSS